MYAEVPLRQTAAKGSGLTQSGDAWPGSVPEARPTCCHESSASSGAGDRAIRPPEEEGYEKGDRVG